MIALLLTLALGQEAPVAPVPPVETVEEERAPGIPADAVLLPDPGAEPAPLLRPDGQPEYLEIMVVSPLMIVAARDQIVRSMTELGWKSRRRKDGTVWFRGPEGWMGKAQLTRNGELEFSQPVLAFGGVKEAGGAYDPKKATDGYMAGGTVGISTIPLPNKDIVRGVQDQIADAVREDVVEYRRMLQQRYFSDYVTELPERLNALWNEGVALDGGDTVVDIAKRRKAVLDFWATRTDTVEGRTISRTVEQWLRNVVMASAFPVTPEEAAKAESRREDARKLDVF